MTYYIRNIELPEAVICDPCGATRWEENPKYGTNVDARHAERDMTGTDWCWAPMYSDTLKHRCQVCGTVTK